MLHFNWEKELFCKVIEGGKILQQLKSLNPPHKKNEITYIVNVFFNGYSITDVTYKSRFMIAFFESDDEYYSFFNFLKNTYPQAGHGAFLVEVGGGIVRADNLDLMHTIIKQISDPKSKYFLKPEIK